MHISRVELENIKSHTSSAFNFTRGTTAITGENGAGKTTIIEAIAWALFDVLDYKKEDFVRRGAKKGSVKVTFESGLDGREYVVTRDSGAGYNVADPRLRTRIADKKEEVFRFLWQHLGLEPGTDLKSLFKQAIGVPQGTLTAIFLEGATERKVAFDRLLKVEEYRQAAEKLRDTSRFLDNSIAGIRESIARAEGELSRSESVNEEYENVSTQAVKLMKEFGEIDRDLKTRRTSVADLDEKERCVSGLKTALERSRSDREKAELVSSQAASAIERAQKAAEAIVGVRTDHERHLKALARLKELEREREMRDRLRAEIAKTDAAMVSVRADQKRSEEDLRRIQNSRVEIEDLRPKVVEQTAVEKQITELRERVTKARGADERIESIDRELSRLRDRYRVNQERIREAEDKAELASRLDDLENRNTEILTELATLKAHFEHDQNFQSDIQGVFCPVLSQRSSKLRDDETFKEMISLHLSDMTARIDQLEAERNTISEDLARARKGHQMLAALESYRQRESELKEEGAELNAKKSVLDERRHGVDQNKIDELTAQLKALADPAARIRILEKEIARESDIRTSLGDVESNLERLDSDRKRLDEQMNDYRQLDDEWSRLTSERDATADAHRTYLANEKDAASLDDRRREAEAAIAELTAKITIAEAAERDYKTAGVDYDAELHVREKTSLVAAERRAAETRATLDAVKKRETQLADEIRRFTELRKSLAGEFQEKERLETVAQTTAFIRDTLKEAAPRVARNYVHRVSLEANLMFREIMGTGERTLEWGEDYAVTLEEDGYERPFASLSGGEQMAAALSIRLALLKQLSDIRVAFFDEPTANMDAERRENLAMQISRITNFDQLFVISHDETFDNFVDNVVSIRRSENDAARSALGS